MSERGIIFGADMVRAIVTGSKTQTRRLLNPQPWPGQGVCLCPTDGAYWQIRSKFGAVISIERLRYARGDDLWVREAWRAACYMDTVPPREMRDGSRIHYEADGLPALPLQWGRLRSAIHLPRRFSRVGLAITDVRLQRVREISEGDARAEGFAPHVQEGRNPVRHSARDEFSYRWARLHGPDAWDDNPYVAAITFKVLPQVPA